ncbi:MAG TPA: PVC-type heme-binding CxxCH protein [Tepidisphaeraceae bacterium]|jgi:putative membrane-bound dehydrogenase-like protein|nr:PVC-type heme-binding CxxCH protein [Tepidisphaeraceae bacterium]
MNRIILLACTAAVAGVIGVKVWAAVPTVTAKDLPRIKATEPADAVRTLSVRPGFHAELAAAEPLVKDPIAMAFDEDGRMYVIEMTDYSERRAEKLSRIVRLEDTDGDGVYDKKTVFLDHLAWATAITCVNGGVLIGACPDVIFAKDTNGDGVADETKILFTGFGNTQTKLNVQGLFNNFIWGPDNRIHGCSGEDGGMVTQAEHPDRPALDVRGKGFVIDPRDWSMTTEAGGGQYGLSFDPWGRLFTCTNSSHLEMFMYDGKYASRNPYYTMPDPRVSIAADGPAAEVFRISPEEPWRVIRTRWRVGGLVGGPIEGGGRSAGYFTGATGSTIYKGDAFPKDYYGDAFVGDAGGNLVHHKRLRPDGVGMIGERLADEKTREFCASTDTWFRPVDFANAPDGTFYVSDMYREVIEHPWSIPPQIKQFLDLNSGNDRGRIYRLAPDGFKSTKPPMLSAASTADLVKLLEHPNAWHHETAARLLFEKQDAAAIPLLKQMITQSTQPLGRLNALEVLDGFDAIDESTLKSALADANPFVREHAVKLIEHQIKDHVVSDGLWSNLVKLANDPADRVRYQVAFTLGEIQHEGRVPLLAAIAKRDLNSQWVRAAVLSSLSEGAGEVLSQLWSDSAVAADPAGSLLFTDLAKIIGSANRDAEITAAIQLISTGKGNNATILVARGLLDGAANINATDAMRTRLAGVIDTAKGIATDNSQSTENRAAAIGLLAYGEFDAVQTPLLGLIGTHQKETLSAAALSALDHFDSPAVADAMIARWDKLSGRERNDAVGILVKRPARAMALLNAIKANQIPASQISAQQVAFLQSYQDPAVQTLARSLLVTPAAKREAVVEQFQPALSLTGDRAKGKLIYEQRCISCHRLEGEGNAVGPDLVSVKNSGKEKLLVSILDPSREVAPSYVAYVVETTDGETLVGIIASDTTTSITIRMAYAKEVVLPRSKIKRMTSDHRSLMPDGLEAGLNQQNVADLLEFISTTGN